jgi:hypothetical protein
MKSSLKAVAAFIAFSVLASAQTATGILQGRVVDATSAVVPEAKVAVENESTGVQTSLLTNSEGAFYQSFLLPGNYRVTVEKPGFQKEITRNIHVDVQQTVSLNMVLKVGDIASAVEVQAASVQLSTASSSV